MKKIFSILKGLFVRRGSDWIILIISLLIAFIMWSFVRLSQRYSITFKYDVKANTTMRGHVSSAVSNNPILVRGRATGFFIMKHKYNKNNSLIEINIDPKLLKMSNSNEDLFSVSGQEIRDEIQQSVDPELTVENISIDSLSFYFFRQAYKKVPVIPRTNISYSKQYINSESIKVKPDSLLIFGKNALVESVSEIYTKEINGDKLKKSISGIVELQPIDNISFSDNEVFYSLAVDRYFETSLFIPLDVVNAPDNVTIPVPGEVEIKFKAIFNGSKKYNSSDFKAYIDYKLVLSRGNENGYAKVQVESLAKGVIDIQVLPTYVKIY